MRDLMRLENRVKIHASGGDGRPILLRQEGKQRSSVCSWKPLTLSKRGFNHARSTDKCTRNLCDVTNGPFGTFGRNKFPLKFEKLRRACNIAKDGFAISGSHVALDHFYFSIFVNSLTISREKNYLTTRCVVRIHSNKVISHIFRNRDSCKKYSYNEIVNILLTEATKI